MEVAWILGVFLGGGALLVLATRIRVRVGG